MFSSSTRGNNAAATCAWTSWWIGRPHPCSRRPTASCGDRPTQWRWASRLRRTTMIACPRPPVEFAQSRRTYQVSQGPPVSDAEARARVQASRRGIWRMTAPRAPRVGAAVSETQAAWIPAVREESSCLSGGSEECRARFSMNCENKNHNEDFKKLQF